MIFDYLTCNSMLLQLFYHKWLHDRYFKNLSKTYFCMLGVVKWYSKSPYDKDKDRRSIITIGNSWSCCWDSLVNMACEKATTLFVKMLYRKLILIPALLVWCMHLIWILKAMFIAHLYLYKLLNTYIHRGIIFHDLSYLIPFEEYLEYFIFR